MISLRPFLVCIHDATPAYARETETMICDLAPLLGRRFSFGIVPDWHGQWRLGASSDYCRLVQENAEERLLHGCFHERRRGWGPTSLLTGGSDEMNGLDARATHQVITYGQRVLRDIFGVPARGFLAPAWQQGHVTTFKMKTLSLEHLLGFFSLQSCTGQTIRLATFTWDCGRWSGLGHVGHGIGRLLQWRGSGVPSLAIHPGDLKRGFWPQILRLVTELLDAGYEPSTPSRLLEAKHAEAAV